MAVSVKYCVLFGYFTLFFQGFLRRPIRLLIDSCTYRPGRASLDTCAYHPPLLVCYHHHKMTGRRSLTKVQTAPCSAVLLLIICATAKTVQNTRCYKAKNRNIDYLSPWFFDVSLQFTYIYFKYSDFRKSYLNFRGIITKECILIIVSNLSTAFKLVTFQVTKKLCRIWDKICFS